MEEVETAVEAGLPLPVDPEVALGDDRREERGVAAEAVGVDRRPRVGIHAPVEQPLRDLQLVEVGGDVEERRPVHRRPLSGVRLPGAGRGEREDVGDVERAREEIRVAREVRLEQVDAPAMERHHRRVGRLEAVLDVHLQDAMFGGRVPAVGPEEVLHGVRGPRPSGPTTRAPSVRRTAVPSTLSVYAGPASVHFSSDGRPARS